MARTVLVAGATGMLGSDVVAALRGRGDEVLTPTRAELDVTDPTSIANLAAGNLGRPEWIVNCAAYTAVDKAEEERQAATELNALAPGYLAQASALLGARMLHVSTDFVFDGARREPYDEQAETRPLGVYGESKLAGESAVLALPGTLVVRTAWLFGPNGKSFPRTMIEAWRAGKTLRVVADQTGSPTYTGDLSRVIAELVAANPEGGTYHAAGSEEATWHRVATEAILAYRRWASANGAEADLDRPVEVAPIRTEDWPTPARRPAYSVLATKRLQAAGIAPMRPLAEVLDEFVARLYGNR